MNDTEDRSRLARSGVRGWQIAALAAVGVFFFIRFDRHLPRIPWLSSDSDGYIRFSPGLSHGYPLFLSTYRLLFEDLAYLPSLQLALYVLAVFSLALAVTQRTGSVTAGLAALLLILGFTDTTEFPYIMSDTVYAAALAAGASFILFYFGTLRPSFLLLAASAIGTAAVFRAVGVALLPAFLAAVMAHAAYRRRNLVTVGLLSALPVALLYCGAASSQLMRHGRFVAGGWGGMDLLGKVALLSHPLPEDSPLARLNWIISEMEPARQKLAQLNDPLLEALIARQYYDHLRWYVVVPDLERRWTAWREADQHQRGWLAAELVHAYIAADPLGIFRRTVIDLLGLWLMPRWLTKDEQQKSLAKIASLGDLPFLTAFADTAEGQLEFYKIIPAPRNPADVFIFRMVVAGFWVLSIGFALLVVSRLRPRALLIAPDLLFIILAVHSSYIAIAIMEGTYERYIMPIWPLLTVGPILALGLLVRATKAQLTSRRL